MGPLFCKIFQNNSGSVEMNWGSLLCQVFFVAFLSFFAFHFFTCFENYFSFFTSSPAQGGGGIFKNRKPIGEVGCCESRMAERSH